MFKRLKFRRLRQQKRWSLSAFAQSSGISRTSLSLWENGRTIPSEKMIRVLANFLDVKISEISELKEDMPVSSHSLSDFTDSWFLLSNFDERIHKNNIGGLVGGIVTLDKQVRQASMVINAIISSMHSLFYVKDTEQKYIIANKAFLQVIAKNETCNIVGKKDRDLFSLKDAEKNTLQDNNVMLFGKGLFDVEGFIPGTRKKKWGLISKIPILDQKGEVTGIAGIMIDISDRKRNEQKRFALNEAVNHLDECVWVAKILNLEKNKYKVVYINDAIEKMTGVKKENFLREPGLWLNFIHPDFKEKVDKAREINEFPRHYEYKAIRQSNGEEYWRSDVTYKVGDMFFGIAREVLEPSKKIDNLLKNNNLKIASNLKKNGVSIEVILKSINLTRAEMELL
jgi:PAS domain-containing protein